MEKLFHDFVGAAAERSFGARILLLPCFLLTRELVRSWATTIDRNERALVLSFVRSFFFDFSFSCWSVRSAYATTRFLSLRGLFSHFVYPNWTFLTWFFCVMRFDVIKIVIYYGPITDEHVHTHSFIASKTIQMEFWSVYATANILFIMITCYRRRSWQRTEYIKSIFCLHLFYIESSSLLNPNALRWPRRMNFPLSGIVRIKRKWTLFAVFILFGWLCIEKICLLSRYLLSSLALMLLLPVDVAAVATVVIVDIG